MSEQVKSTTVEKPKRRAPNKLNKAGAVAMTSLGVMSGILAPAAKAAENAGPQKAKVELAQKELKNPSELPGIKIHLGKEVLNQLKSATVEVGVRTRPDLSGDTSQNFSPGCTAVRVSIGGETDPIFATAAHCFSNLTNARSGGLTDPKNPGVKAENYAGLSTDQFAILDPGESDLGRRTAQPVAIVDQISISTDYKDIALLHVKSTDVIQNSSSTIRSLSEIPALPLKALRKIPKPGTPVAMYGEPQANGFGPVAGTGIYLGRIVYTYKDALSGETVNRLLDMVGINAKAPQSDRCNFGASGSVVELPDRQILGNLSTRINLGYGPTHTMQFGDLSLEDNLYWVSQFEQQLGISLRGFTTICGFTVIDNDTPRHLVSGFGIPANGKGGDPSGGKG